MRTYQNVGPMGNVMFKAVGRTDVCAYWNGPGSGLYLMLGPQTMTRIEHPTADGSYATAAEARAAFKAFAYLFNPKHAR